MNSNTQLYSFILLGLVLAFIWPINMLYTFLLTRAYIRDKTNLFKSFYEEIIEQGNNTMTLVNQFIKNVNQQKNKKKKSNKTEEKKSNKEDEKGENKSDEKDNKVNSNIINKDDSSGDENVLRKRNTLNESTLSDDIDTI